MRNAHTGGLLCGHGRWIHTSAIRQEQGEECTHRWTSVWARTLDTHINNQAGARQGVYTQADFCVDWNVGYTHQQSGRSKVRNAHTGGLLCGHERWIHTSTIR